MVGGNQRYGNRNQQPPNPRCGGVPTQRPGNRSPEVLAGQNHQWPVRRARDVHANRWPGHVSSPRSRGANRITRHQMCASRSPSPEAPPAQNGAPVTWDIARVAGEQPNGTLVLHAPDSSTPKPLASLATPARKQPGSALVDETNALVDSFAQVLERSLTLYQGRIKPEEDRSRPALPDELGPKPKWSEVINDMATATNSRPTRDVVDFPPNAPVTVALKYSQGRTISGQYGERVMFTLTDGRVMFLAPEVAGRIESLGINVRESFTITRGSASQNGVPVTWDIARVEGEQPNGTLVPRASDAAISKPPTSAATADGGIPRKQAGNALVDEANALVDSYAQVLE